MIESAWVGPAAFERCLLRSLTMSVLSHLTSLFASEGDAPADDAGSRLGKLVSRHREELAAEVQRKLSTQATDPAPEEVTEPLYDLSVYTAPVREL
jgi:hypothetical protein